MYTSTSRYVQEKRLFYGRQEVSRDYDRLRFSGPGGAWVNDRELKILTTLLPPQGKVLDLGCGTGRLSLHLRELGYAVTGLDSSADMLEIAQGKSKRKDIAWLQGDAFALPLASASFDAVVALRVAFHFSDLLPLLTTTSRAVRPAGTIVFDTYKRSPRAVAPIGSRNWGGRVYIHRSDYVKQVADELGLEVVERSECFLFSPYIYRLLPLPIVRGLERLEAHVPTALRSRVFWRLRASSREIVDGEKVWNIGIPAWQN